MIRCHLTVAGCLCVHATREAPHGRVAVDMSTIPTAQPVMGFISASFKSALFAPGPESRRLSASVSHRSVREQRIRPSAEPP
jgi:hypothetical protein